MAYNFHRSPTTLKIAGAPDLGSEGRRFESYRSDHKYPSSTTVCGWLTKPPQTVSKFENPPSPKSSLTTIAVTAPDRCRSGGTDASCRSNFALDALYAYTAHRARCPTSSVTCNACRRKSNSRCSAPRWTIRLSRQTSASGWFSSALPMKGNSRRSRTTFSNPNRSIGPLRHMDARTRSHGTRESTNGYGRERRDTSSAGSRRSCHPILSIYIRLNFTLPFVSYTKLEMISPGVT